MLGSSEQRLIIFNFLLQEVSDTETHDPDTECSLIRVHLHHISIIPYRIFIFLNIRMHLFDSELNS